jgi:hypothetical protein
MAVELGSQYRFEFQVRNDLGVLIDPSTKTVTVLLPDQTTASPSIVQDSLGTFHSDYTTVQEGIHKFTANTTGPVTTKSDYVPVNVYRSLIGIDEARIYIGETDTTRDDILRMVLSALTDKIESVVGNCIQRTFTNERQSGSEAHVIKLKHGPLPSDTAVTSISSVFAGGPSWVTAQLIVFPDSATIQTADQLDFWYGPWKATYVAGRIVTPVAIQLALKEALFDFWANQRPYGAGDLEPGLTATSEWEERLAQYDIPPHAKSLLEPFEQPGFA